MLLLSRPHAGGEQQPVARPGHGDVGQPPLFGQFVPAALLTESPDSPLEVIAVPGVGARKLEAYGDAVLALVRGETPTAAGDPDDPA